MQERDGEFSLVLKFHSHPVFQLSFRQYLGRVVRKPVSTNPGLKVNQSINFYRVKMVLPT